MKEPPALKLALTALVWGKYLAFRICVLRRVSSWIILQHCLASMLMLKQLKSLNLSPPQDLDLETQRSSHFFQ